jgi:hypothetical protein
VDVGTTSAEGESLVATSLVFEMCAAESLIEVKECEGGLAPGAPGVVDTSCRERSARDTWATSTGGDGFPGFLSSGAGAGAGG